MDYNPLHDRVVVKRKEAVTKTASGFFIPQVSAEVPDQGTVLAVGPGRITEEGVLIPMTVVVGDTVLWGRGTGVTVKLNGETALVLKESEIFAVVTDE